MRRAWRGSRGVSHGDGCGLSIRAWSDKNGPMVEKIECWKYEMWIPV